MNPLRSTPLRLTGTLIVIFMVFTSTGYAVAFFVTRSALSGDVAARLEQTVEAIRTIPEQDEIVERAAEIAAAADPRDMLLRYVVPGGRTLGNLPEPISIVSGAIVGEAELSSVGQSRADSYLAWQGPVGQGTLTLLVGRDSVVGLGETFSQVLLFSLVPALLIASIVGALVARSARDRVEAIRTTLAQLTSGHHGARVPVPRDVGDDLGQIANAVNRMAEAQQASIEALRQVSADIAHDLRTPIQRVGVLLERLEGDALTGRGRATIAAARAETAQIVETFQALLQIAQLESGQSRMRFTEVDLSALVAGLRRRLRPRGGGKRPRPERDVRRVDARPGRSHPARAAGGEPDRECPSPHAAGEDPDRRLSGSASGTERDGRGSGHPRSRAGPGVAPALSPGTQPNERGQRPRPEPRCGHCGPARRSAFASGCRAGADRHAILSRNCVPTSP